MTNEPINTIAQTQGQRTEPLAEQKFVDSYHERSFCVQIRTFMSTIRTRILQSSHIPDHPKHFSAKLRSISHILPELKVWIWAL